MAEMEKTEFVFPDEMDTEIEVEKPSSQEETKPLKKAEEEKEIAIEVVDDRPAEDRNRKPSKAPDEVTEEELENYSEKVRKRLQHFSKGYHDQRRAAEAAQRERDEAVALAQQMLEENNKLKGTVSKNHEAMLEQAKRMVNTELEEAKRRFKIAHESGDSDAVVAAQEQMTAAKLKAERVNNFKLPALQPEENTVKPQTFAQPPVADARAAEWQKQNPWFGPNDEMTGFALGLHQRLVKAGVNPQSDEYYEKINSRLRQVFPDQFEDTSEEVSEAPRKKPSVVAPATRSTAPKRVVLTKTQVALAKRLNLPLEVYAKQVAKEMRNQNG